MSFFKYKWLESPDSACSAVCDLLRFLPFVPMCRADHHDQTATEIYASASRLIHSRTFAYPSLPPRGRGRRLAIRIACDAPAEQLTDAAGNAPCKGPQGWESGAVSREYPITTCQQVLRQAHTNEVC